MIFRKPYAFLIKNFKIIHIVLTIFIVYSMTKFNSIIKFFSNYMISQRYDVSNYLHFVSSFTLFVLLLIFSFGLIMLLLMKKKKKPYLFYVLLCVYYILIFILSINASNIISELGNATLSQKATRAYHDIYLILSFPSYYFLFASLVRGLGFDIKKFNFSKDLNEFELSNEDNEEFELVIGSNTYLYKRKIWRILREIKYIILERKLLFIIIGGATGVIILITLLLDSTIFNKVYRKGSSVNVLNYNLVYNDSYLTNYDYNGKKIDDKYDYIIVDMTLKNNGDSSVIKNSDVYLSNGINNYYLDTMDGEYFIDFGKAYSGGMIASQSVNDYLFIFKVPKKVFKTSYKLHFYSGRDIQEDGQYEYKYTKFKIKPTKINNENELVKSNFGDKLYLGNINYNDSTITINDVSFASSYEYKYNVCDGSNCKEYYNIQTVDNISKNTLAIVKYDSNISNNSKIFSSSDLNKEYYLFDKLFYIKYTLNNKSFIVPCTIKVNNDVENILFLNVNRSILNSTNISLILRTRENYYEIIVK